MATPSSVFTTITAVESVFSGISTTCTLTNTVTTTYLVVSVFSGISTTFTISNAPAAPLPSSSSDSSSNYLPTRHHGISGGAIAGIVIGSVAALNLILLGFCFCFDPRRRRRCHQSHYVKHSRTRSTTAYKYLELEGTPGTTRFDWRTKPWLPDGAKRAVAVTSVPATDERKGVLCENDQDIEYISAIYDGKEIVLSSYSSPPAYQARPPHDRATSSQAPPASEADQI